MAESILPVLDGQPAPVNTGGFSADYVKSLRDENAAWRTKLRDTESVLQTVQSEVAQIKLDTTVGSELAKRNLNIEPSWIKLQEGQTVEQSVDAFVKTYPQMATQTAPRIIPQQVNSTQKPLATQQANTNVPGTQPTELSAVKQDPVARARLRDQYRSMLKDGHAGATI